MFVAMGLTGPQAVVRCPAASSGLTSKCVFEQTRLPNDSVPEGYPSLACAVLSMGAVFSKIGPQVISQTRKRKL